MFRKPASKPVPVAPMTVAALNAMMEKTPYFFSRTDRGNLQFFARYSNGGGYTCPRSEVENYMQYVMKMPLGRAIECTYNALAHSEPVAQA